MTPALLLTLLTISCTFFWPWPGVTLPGLQDKGVQVNPCCSKGEQLVLKELRSGGKKAECVQFGIFFKLELLDMSSYDSWRHSLFPGV